jgi:hypothetical protein
MENDGTYTMMVDDGTGTGNKIEKTVIVTNGMGDNGMAVADLLAAGYVMQNGVTEGGRRHRGSKKAHKKTRNGNKMLSSWVAFVKKVQRDEQISYSDAMKRASARKKEWKRGQMGGEGAPTPVLDYDDDSDDETYGGRRRRRTKRRGTKKRRGSRRRR